MKRRKPLEALVQILAMAAVEEFCDSDNLLKIQEEPMEPPKRKDSNAHRQRSRNEERPS
jgi:hypothetical protein